MDLHPYDNVERRYRHTDVVQVDGLAALARVLGLTQMPRDEARYDLSFFSGGIGVLDYLAITLPADPLLWEAVVATLGARTPEEAGDDVSWAPDLCWLLTHEERMVPLRPSAVRFINRARREFQVECHPTSRILFQRESDVNDWVTLWGDDTILNYLGYSQG